MPLTLDELATRKKVKTLDELASPEAKPEQVPFAPPFGGPYAVPQREPEIESPGFAGPTTIGAPDPTSWQKFKNFFQAKRTPLPPNPTRMEKADRVFDVAVGTPLRVFLKFAKGKTLNIPDLMWAGIKKITPDDLWEDEVGKMNLDQAMDWAAGYDPSGFEKVTGGLAEFIGRLSTAGKIGRQTGVLAKKDFVPYLGKLGRASEAAKMFGLAGLGEQISKGIAEQIDESDYGYEGAKGVLIDMGIGAGLSLAGSVVRPGMRKVAETSIGKRIIEGADKAVVELSRKFPRLMDLVRGNPRKYFAEKTDEDKNVRENAQNALKKLHKHK